MNTQVNPDLNLWQVLIVLEILSEDSHALNLVPTLWNFRNKKCVFKWLRMCFCILFVRFSLTWLNGNIVAFYLGSLTMLVSQKGKNKSSMIFPRLRLSSCLSICFFFFENLIHYWLEKKHTSLWRKCPFHLSFVSLTDLNHETPSFLRHISRPCGNESVTCLSSAFPYL